MPERIRVKGEEISVPASSSGACASSTASCRSTQYQMRRKVRPDTMVAASPELHGLLIRKGSMAMVSASLGNCGELFIVDFL